MKYLKKILKKILRYFDWKLIKIQKTQTSFVHQKPNIEEINCILDSNGILHLGAHRGKESVVYNWFNKQVLWIEANPVIFEDLNDNIKLYYKQNALNLLLGDKNLNDVDFFISNKDFSCSSIHDLSDEVKKGDLWKEHDVRMVDKIKLNMITLDNAVEKYNINLKNFDHWVVDLQGAEAQFLKGADKSIKYCKSMVIEISKKKFYSGNSANWIEIKKILKNKGFTNLEEPKTDHCDILFKKSIE